MWTAKFKVYDKDGVYSTRAKKFRVHVYGYPLNYYSDKRDFYFVGVGFLEGNEKAKKEYLKDLKKDTRVHKLESQNESKRYVHLFYNPLIVHINPTVIYSDGWEENEIACFERKFIEDILKISEKLYKLMLSYLKQQKIKNIGILNILPGLTEKQKQAITLAAREGYYTYPRKKYVQDLAKMVKLSFSTFQEHLRKAENKLIPFNIKKL